jgi:D-tyrosyl-tRNA(Tyr) deacylase
LGIGLIALLQRVSEARVTVESKTVGQIGPGLVIFLGVDQGDTSKEVEFLVQKISGFRIFNDSEEKMNRSIRDVNGSALVISQFTLCADWRKGRRPSFVKAADPETGKTLYHQFIARLKDCHIPVETGQFGAMMKVQLINDGPVTFVLDTNQ